MMITKRLGANEFFTQLLSKRSWVRVIEKQGGIKVETPQEGPNAPAQKFKMQG
jgi:hypothetical protein